MYFNLLFLFLPTIHSYSFCPNCKHSDGSDVKCDLFKQHPLYKDHPDVHSVGKEICGAKGKYFISGGKKENAGRDIKEQNTHLFKGNFKRIVRD